MNFNLSKKERLRLALLHKKQARQETQTITEPKSIGELKRAQAWIEAIFIIRLLDLVPEKIRQALYINERVARKIIGLQLLEQATIDYHKPPKETVVGGGPFASWTTVRNALPELRRAWQGTGMVKIMVERGRSRGISATLVFVRAW